MKSRMRENRTYGSVRGERRNLSYVYKISLKRGEIEFVYSTFVCLKFLSPEI